MYSEDVDPKYYPSYRLLDGAVAVEFSSLEGMLNSPINDFGGGTIWQAGGFRYLTANGLAPDAHMTTAGGIRLYVQPDPDGAYNALAFGADPTGATDMTGLLRSIMTRLPAGATLRLPAGRYAKSGSGSGQEITLPEGVNLVGDTGATLISEGYPILRALGGNEIRGLTFDNRTGDVLIGIEVQGHDVTIRNNHFQGGNEQVRLYTADRCSVDDNIFESTGYAVIQRSGHSSNAARVSRNRFLECTGDCIELNSEIANPCTAWQITDNYAQNIGGSAPSAISTEDRFLGVTATRGMIVSANIIEGVAGDSVFHFEGIGGDCIIDSNLITNPHGGYGSLLYFVSSQSPAAFHFSHNVVLFDETYTAITGDSRQLVYMEAGDEAQVFMTGNIFRNDSAEALTVGRMSHASNLLLNVTENFFRGFQTILKLANGTNSRVNFHGNSCMESSPGGSVLELQADAPAVSVRDNAFYESGETWNSSGGTNPVEISGNTFRGAGTQCALAACLDLVIAAPSYSRNSFTEGATHDLINTRTYTGGSGPVVIFDISKEKDLAYYPMRTLCVRVKRNDLSDTTIYKITVVRIGYAEYAYQVDSSINLLGGATASFSMSGSKLCLSSPYTRYISVSTEAEGPHHTPELLPP